MNAVIIILIFLRKTNYLTVINEIEVTDLDGRCHFVYTNINFALNVRANY